MRRNRQSAMRSSRRCVLVSLLGRATIGLAAVLSILLFALRGGNAQPQIAEDLAWIANNRKNAGTGNAVAPTIMQGIYGHQPLYLAGLIQIIPLCQSWWFIPNGTDRR